MLSYNVFIIMCYYVGHLGGMVASTVAPFVTLQVTIIQPNPNIERAKNYRTRL